jgi:hypothetical protein
VKAYENAQKYLKQVLPDDDQVITEIIAMLNELRN